MAETGMTTTLKAREFSAGGVRWVVRGDAADALAMAGALDLARLQENPTARVVAKGARLMVFRVTVPASDGKPLELLVERRRWPRLRDLAATLFHASDARRQWRVAQTLEAWAIPAVRVVAAGHKRAWGVLREDCIITECADGATPLDRFVADVASRSGSGPSAVDSRDDLVRRAASVLAELVRRMHDAGVHSRDLRAGDFSVRTDDAGHHQLMIGELRGLRVAEIVTLGERIDDIAGLNRFFSTTSRAARARFWKTYIRGIPFLEEHAAEYARLIESHSAAARERMWRRLERRCLGTNDDFLRFRARGLRGHTLRGRIELPPEALARIPAQGLAMPDATVIKDSDETRIWEQRVDFGPGQINILVKHKKRAGLGRLLRTFGRRVGAVASWRTAHAMEARGLPVEEALAAFERRRLGLTFESWLITRKVEDAENLWDFAKKHVAGKPLRDTRPLRRSLALELARLIRRLHERGFTQRDLKSQNILVQWDDGGEVRLTLVDFEGVRRRARVSDKRRARDIGRLAADAVRMSGVLAGDMMRFFDAYLAGEDASRERRREMMARILRRVKEKREAWKAKGY